MIDPKKLWKLKKKRNMEEIVLLLLKTTQEASLIKAEQMGGKMEQNRKNTQITFGNLDYDKQGITTHWANKRVYNNRAVSIR